MNQDNNVTSSISENVMICPKCGSEMKKDARYCMKCGNLNYAHPENESMKQYAWQSIKQGQYVAGVNVNNNYSMKSVSSISNYDPFKKCLMINIILYVVLAALVVMGLYTMGLLSDLSVGFIICIVISFLLTFLISYSTQAMYIKANEPWWGFYVPIYNLYILYKIALGNGWLFLTLIVPVVGMIVNWIAFYNLGKKFYKNGWLTLFFPFVMIPIIGLSKKVEYSMLAKETTLSDNQLDAKGKTRSERIYGRNKLILTTIIVIVIAIILYFGWPYLWPLLEKLYEFFMEQLEFFK